MSPPLVMPVFFCLFWTHLTASSCTRGSHRQTDLVGGQIKTILSFKTPRFFAQLKNKWNLHLSDILVSQSFLLCCFFASFVRKSGFQILTGGQMGCWSDYPRNGSPVCFGPVDPKRKDLPTKVPRIWILGPNSEKSIIHVRKTEKQKKIGESTSRQIIHTQHSTRTFVPLTCLPSVPLASFPFCSFFCTPPTNERWLCYSTVVPWLEIITWWCGN